MPKPKGTLRICPNGHSYYKSSDCPTCPICEQAKKPASGMLSKRAAPARRALERKGITTLAKLSKYSEKDILALHGIGPSAMPLLRAALAKDGRTFKPASKDKLK